MEKKRKTEKKRKKEITRNANPWEED